MKHTLLRFSSGFTSASSAARSSQSSASRRRTFSERFAKGAVLKEALDQLEAEGYCAKFAFDISHEDRIVELVVKAPLSLRLKRIARELSAELTDEEVSAIGRGAVSGVLSAIVGSDVDVKEEERTAGDTVAYVLPRKVCVELFSS